MKAFFGMTAAVLLVVFMLFLSLPGTGLAAERNVLKSNMPIRLLPLMTINGDGKAYCENNNIMRPDGTLFAECGEKICEENPYGAMCVARVSPSSAQGLLGINPLK